MRKITAASELQAECFSGLTDLEVGQLHALLARLRERLVAWLRAHGGITTGEFKELVGATRKLVLVQRNARDAMGDQADGPLPAEQIERLVVDRIKQLLPQLQSTLPKAVQVSNLTLAMGKSVVFGILIALIACHYGLRVKPNTESLGQGTTASVVTSITVVLLVDALFAVVFKDIGI